MAIPEVLRCAWFGSPYVERAVVLARREVGMRAFLIMSGFPSIRCLHSP